MVPRWSSLILTVSHTQCVRSRFSARKGASASRGRHRPCRADMPGTCNAQRGPGRWPEALLVTHMSRLRRHLCGESAKTTSEVLGRLCLRSSDKSKRASGATRQTNDYPKLVDDDIGQDESSSTKGRDEKLDELAQEREDDS